MTRLIFVFILFFSVPAFAGSFTDSFLDWLKTPFYEIYYFFTESIPALLTRATAYFIEWAVYLKFYLMLESLDFAYSVASQIMADLNLAGYLSTAVDGLPSNVKAVMAMWGLGNCFNLIIHAWLTAFVMDFMGW